ncbi:MAG: hypothetical protein IPI64_14635 [Chloracidobacterium sp.]|nr:hypothetical protein [Chloracidobacterium sp.]
MIKKKRPMKCPQCGSQTLAEQQFCRSCGGQLTSERAVRINPQLWGLMMAFGGILIAIAAGMFEIRAVVLIGAFISISGMFFIAGYPMIASSLKNRNKTANPPELPANTPTTKKLSPIGDFEYVPVSVTENTTNLLKDPAPTKKR